MDKKLAEDDAMKKAKDAQAAAGKNSGMSGRDLVRFSVCVGRSRRLMLYTHSSHTTQSGSTTQTKKRTSGTLQRIVRRKRTKTLPWKKSGYGTSVYRTAGLPVRQAIKMSWTGLVRDVHACLVHTYLTQWITAPSRPVLPSQQRIRMYEG